MNWLFKLHETQPIAHAIGALAFVCVLGMSFGSVKFRGIGLGTAVLIPDERSEMSMAAAIATIARLSAGRFRACFGTGATARRTMGQLPMTLRALEDYVIAVRGLLAGETVTIDGQPARMLNADFGEHGQRLLFVARSRHDLDEVVGDLPG